MFTLRKIQQGWRGAVMVAALFIAGCAAPDPTRYLTRRDVYDIEEARARHEQARQEMGVEAFRLGQRAFSEGDLARAHRLWNQAARLQPGWDLPFVQLALLHPLYDNDLAAQIRELNQAVAINAENPRTRLYLGIAYAQNGQMEYAEPCLREALRLRPDYREARLRLANLLRDAHRLPEAIAAYEALLAESPHESFVQAALAALYEEAGRLRDAEGMLLRLIASERDTAYAYYKLARFYERHARANDAKAAAKRAEALNPRPARRVMRPLLPSRR